MAEKIYYNSGILNYIKDKKSDKAPDCRINLTLDSDTMDAIIKAGGKMQLAGWVRQGRTGEFTSFVASADTYVKPAGEPAKANGYVADELESDIPF
jgi:hypothetical protein